MASSMGGDFVQAYVMRRLHKEKVERIVQQEMESKPRSSCTNKKKSHETNKNRSGFFGLMRKKVHPNGMNSGEAGAPVAGDVWALD